jgi:hypothetical protein
LQNITAEMFEVISLQLYFDLALISLVIAMRLTFLHLVFILFLKQILQLQLFLLRAITAAATADAAADNFEKMQC